MYYDSLANTGKMCGAVDNYWEAMPLDCKIAWFLVIAIVLWIMSKPKGGNNG